MQELRAGKVLRLVRRRRGLTQSDLAALAGVSQQTVSLLERGNADTSTLRLIKQVAAPLGITVDLAFKWKGPELDRLADARHARIVQAVVSRLGPAWELIVEFTFNHYGDRGSVDILAWHAAARALLIIEVKSELDGVESVLRPMDVKARVVPEVIARERGWKIATVGLVLVLPDESATRRAVARVETVLDVALPKRTVAVRRWLLAPDGAIRGLWFLADTPTRRVVRNGGTGGRVVHSRRASSHARTEASTMHLEAQ
jgi:transcriptional regulator with XRE-family HTH domain